MDNETKVSVALITLILIIAVPSIIIWKFVFTNSDSGILVVNHTEEQVSPNAPATTKGKTAAVTPPPSQNLIAITAAANPRRTRTRRIRGARGQGATAAIVDTLPNELSPGPAATANGPVTNAMRLQYLKNLWSGNIASGSEWDRGNGFVYRVATGTVVPATQPTDPSVAPTLITLHSTGSLMQILQAVAEQAKISFVSQNPGLFRGTKVPIQINADRTPLM
ncbi:MAG TPA: hypothetical protein VMD30_10615, partial [Tepidisphaeraceae bacterium]|nr:hypothetical protein [Tepidisphaeraceae bacterium]